MRLPAWAVLALLLAGCGDAGKENASGTDVAPVSVRVVQVQEAPVQSWVYAQGTARAARREFLTFQNSGRVAHVAPGLEIGRPVRRGQLVAHLQPDRSDAELTRARVELANARAQVAVGEAAQAEAAASLELARQTFARFATLLDLDSASQQEYDEAEARLGQARAAYARAQAQLAGHRAQVDAARAQVDVARVTVSESRIVAPITGVIARLNIEEGRYFTPQLVRTQSEQAALDTVPVVIVDPSSYEISVDLPSYTSRELEVGAEALIRPSAAPVPASRKPPTQATGAGNAPPIPIEEFRIFGQVHAVSPALDPETRTYRAMIRTTRGASLLQDGEFVSSWIRGARSEDGPAVPFEAIGFSAGEPYVFVVDREAGRARRRQVELGLAGNEVREVLSGVRTGEYVVTEGRSALEDGDPVRVIGRDRPGRSDGEQDG
ncbi:efflux RND transporter periplasmic adaptor subunit [Luteimonas sp. RD2P54]|uniref:Efflux RND transporter periplasmic adaptor subunit n=1 Tax=Luteimonas endophytica TaxID=3042023 RepID=A0ABT6JA29_9GAMM|nr:efflux RND transporter periplasmic adaptor subunit [Luteimonas endophytica]MDH5823677.1 efflux RND transporter periplasmic adaptor subunit [Luteimonas endophytica]